VINIADLLWIEQRGMSIITAIFFLGAFVTIASLFWWTRREVGDIDAELASQKLMINDSRQSISEVNTEIGKIQVSIENIEVMMGKLIDHILK